MSIYLGNNLIAPNQSNAANKSLSNLNSDGEKHFLNKSQITNCILEAPNGIATYSGNVVTVKEGLKVLIPNGRNTDGTLNNIQFTLPEDVTLTEQNGARTIFVGNDEIIPHVRSCQTDRIQYLDYLPTTVETNNLHKCFNYKTNLWYATYGSTTANWELDPAIPIADVTVVSNEIISFKPKYQLNIIDKNMTDMLIDGQWVSKNYVIAQNVSTTGSTNLTYSLSDYLPNDGYAYEVLMEGYTVTGSATSNSTGCAVSTQIAIHAIAISRATTRTNASVDSVGTTVVPVGTNRNITLRRYASGHIGNVTLTAKAYRKIGTNNS
jgi:hypothetical protein